MSLTEKPLVAPLSDVVPDTQLAGYELTANKIVTLIKETNLQPGKRLPAERTLSEQLGVSRTMIREAVKMLTATGVLRAHKGSGLYVAETTPYVFSIPLSDIEPEDVLSFFEFRETLELKTVGLAAERITPRELRALEESVLLNQECAEKQRVDQFHESDGAIHLLIAQATHNPFLISCVAAMQRLQLYNNANLNRVTYGALLIAAEQHRQIYTAMKDGRTEEAVCAMQGHIDTVRKGYQQEVRRRLRGIEEKE